MNFVICLVDCWREGLLSGMRQLSVTTSNCDCRFVQQVLLFAGAWACLALWLVTSRIKASYELSKRQADLVSDQLDRHQDELRAMLRDHEQALVRALVAALKEYQRSHPVICAGPPVMFG